MGVALEVAASTTPAVDHRTHSGIHCPGGRFHRVRHGDLRGGELSDFVLPFCYAAMVGGVLLEATQIVALFGATGATISEPLAQAEQTLTERLSQGSQR